MKTKEELGTELCKHCVWTDFGSSPRSGIINDIYFDCGEGYCDRAYSTYLVDDEEI